MLPSGMDLLRYSSRNPPGSTPQRNSYKKPELEEERVIRCRRCGYPITLPAEKISIDGSHVHTFANPHGVLYEIGCFRTAAGCGSLGEASGEFSWFKGYRWKIAYCRMCRAHLGWAFLGEGDSFVGLILDRLTESE